MSYPLEAFEYVDAASLEPGSVAADDSGNWFLIARKAGASSNQAVRLTRSDRYGDVGDLLSQLECNVFSVRLPFQVSFRVEDLFDLRRTPDGPFPGSILLAEPPAIYTIDNERHLIGLNGQEINEGTVHRSRARYLKWSIWLVDAHGRMVGDTPLVEIDASGL